MTGIQYITESADLFEGVEKRIELVFDIHGHIPSSLRSLSNADITSILDAAKCAVLVKRTHTHFDAYILSESSLFVYDYKIIILTCGTTTLLCAVPVVIQAALVLGLTCVGCQFTRNTYLFPENQVYPHTSFMDECKYLDTHIPKMKNTFNSCNNTNSKIYSRSKYIWVCYQDSYYTALTKFKKIVYFNIKVMPNYIEKIRDVLTHLVDMYDDYIFTPCGYSLNGYKDDDYITIHVTPQSSCSYVSIEYTGNINISKYDDTLYDILNHFPCTKSDIETDLSCVDV